MRERWEDVLRWTVNRAPVEKAGRGVARTFPAIMEDYVAGEETGDALEYVENDLNPKGVRGLVDLLGEHHEDKDDVREAYTAYRALIREIAERGLDAELSVKLTQLGLDLYEDSEERKAACMEYVNHLAAQSTYHGQRLWLDMEDTAYTDDTIDIYRDLLEQDYDVGLCLQAYLERTSEDIKELPENAGIRLVKGAYDRDREFDSWDAVEDNYEDLLGQTGEKGLYVAAGTHNEHLIGKAEEHAEKYDGYEFQFLMGVKTARAEELAQKHDLAVYVPFGDEAAAYFWRRIQEHPKYLEDFVRDKARSVGDAVRSLVK